MDEVAIRTSEGFKITYVTFEDQGYLRGVLDGDGYIDKSNVNPRLSLKCTDKSFIDLFETALVNCGLTPHTTEQDCNQVFGKYSYHTHYYICRATCTKQFIFELKSLDLSSDLMAVGFLKGFFDSEGNYRVSQNFLHYNGQTLKNGWKHIVRFYNKDLSKLQIVQSLLERFRISSKLWNYSYHVPFVEVSRHKDVKRFLEVTKGKFRGLEKP